jgi:hypothetical protein
MTTTLAALSGLQCVYLALLAVGFLYSLVILIGGELHALGDIDVPGVDVGGSVLHGDVSVASLSPVTLSGFVTAFGAFGLIGMGLFDATGPESLVWASVGGVFVGVASHLAFIYVFIKPQGSSEVTNADLIGATGEVITAVPEGRVGEVALVAQGARFTMSARSVDGAPLARGTIVRVEEVLGNVALVKPDR